MGEIIVKITVTDYEINIFQKKEKYKIMRGKVPQTGSYVKESEYMSGEITDIRHFYAGQDFPDSDGWVLIDDILDIGIFCKSNPENGARLF